MNEHEHFEELCALVVSGLASEEGFRELEDHLPDCGECRDRMGDFTRIGAEILSSKTGSDRAHRPPKGITGRFVARALAEGIPLREPTRLLPMWASRNPLAWAGTIAAGVLLAVLALGSLQRISSLGHRGYNEATARTPVSAPATGGAIAGEGNPRADETVRLQGELNTAIADKQRLSQAVAELNDQIKDKDAHDGELAAQVAALTSERDQLRLASSAKDTQIADLGTQLQRRQAVNSDQFASLAESQIQIRNLRDQLDEQNAMIQEQKSLLAAGSQARDLIIARNLHIIDVHDNNGEGERQRAFGRIFYTEGKQIVFYAYDLNSAAKLKKQVAFYVWGGKLGDEHAVRNLGIFRSEDPSAGRWVLTFDDPHVLAQINTVFVTAESKKNIERPDGRQILFAYLGDKANHP
jgi:hypothetical protein